MNGGRKSVIRLYPLVLEPIFKYRIWGGRRLEQILEKRLPPDEPIGESWEASCRGDDNNVIRNGKLAGTTLADVLKAHREALIGPSFPGETNFALLNKFIDANELLSVQVHPNEKGAAGIDGAEAKTEAWYIIQADPGATLIKGLKAGVTRESFTEAIHNNTVPETLNSIPVSSGDMVFVPAGCVHAMGKGLVICEIQQNSDTTFRVYDWGRIGQDGKPRQLHIEQALRSINFDDRSPDTVPPVTMAKGNNRYTYLIACPYFAVQALTLKEASEESTGGRRFESLMIVEGSGTILTGNGNETSISLGDSVLMPACMGDYTIEPRNHCVVIRIFVPDLETEIKQQLRAEGIPEEKIRAVVFE